MTFKYNKMNDNEIKKLFFIQYISIFNTNLINTIQTKYKKVTLKDT